MDTVYYYGQDGEIVTNEIKNKFELNAREIKYTNDKTYVFDCVGFIIKDENIIFIFPKHYYKNEDIANFNSNHLELQYDIKILYNVIKKYHDNEKKAKPIKYIGKEEKYESNYPFSAFFQIYEYYLKYGLYKERNKKVKTGANGTVSWKKTIEKSNKIISNGNLIYTPLYIKKTNLNDVFITDCMSFIIDYTIFRFHNFFSLKKTGYNRMKFDYIDNIDYIITLLSTYKNKIFKDINKKLVLNMIDFFSQYKNNNDSSGGKIHFCIKNFNLIWQEMINYYLNNHFIGINSNEDGLLFNVKKYSCPVDFKLKTFNDIDDSENHFSISIDHFGVDKNILYIFDSKYFFSKNNLDYKQYGYNEILRYSYVNVKKVFNALIIPGEKNNKLHFSLTPQYAGERKIGNKIIEQYIDTKVVMNDYIKEF